MRTRPALVALLLAATTTLIGCSDDDGGVADPTDTTAAEGITATSAQEGTSTSAGEGTTDTTAAGDEAGSAGDPAGQPIEIEVSGGSVVGGLQRVEVPLGGEVAMLVTADVSDEVHVHGYDLSAEVTPEAPAELSFVADVPGVFEVELEGAHQPLVTLEVS